MLKGNLEAEVWSPVSWGVDRLLYAIYIYCPIYILHIDLCNLQIIFVAEEEEEEGLGEPLILRIDQDDQGSVGSEDTSRYDSDDDLPPTEQGQQQLF